VLHGVVQVAAALAATSAAPNPSNVAVAMPVTNGPVKAIVRIGDRAYIGGDFSRIGRPSGSGVALDSASGKRDARWPSVAGGQVNAVVPDGSGGWYIAGEFSHVGGIARSGLAHLRADRSVDRDWRPSVDGSAVDTMAASRHRIYVASSLTSFGARRRFLVAFDRATGRPDPRFAAERPVTALAVADSTLYAATASAIGAYDVSTGRRRHWQVRLKIDPCREHGHGDCVAAPQVRALAVSGEAVFIGGFFNQVNGAHRRDGAAVDRLTARPLPWAPQPNNPINAVGIAGRAVYVGGSFTRVGRVQRMHLAALDMREGRALAWKPREASVIERLVVGTHAVYVVRTSLRPEEYLAAYQRATGKRLPWRPAPNHWVLALAVSRDGVYVGGAFTGLRSAERRGLAALNLQTRTLEAWNPKLVGSYRPRPDVNALQTDGQRLYVGGEFVEAGGQRRNNLAAFDLRDGSLTTWNPDADGDVSALVVAGATVFASGSFQHVNGAPHDGIAKLDQSGTTMPFAANVGGVLALTRSGDTLYVAGGCDDTANRIERNRGCALNTTTGALLPWNPDADSVVWTLAVSDSAVYAGGVFTEIGRKSRTAVAVLDPVTGDALEWDLHARGNANLGSGASALVSSLVLHGSTLYVGGDFETLGGFPRDDLAAFDVDTRAPTRWAPALTGGPFDQAIGAIVPADDGVLVGGTFLAVGGRPQAYIAFFR
jgi:hypothetical protein